MADTLRSNGKPFVTDSRNAVPRYVVEDDEYRTAVIVNQFTGAREIVGARPYSEKALKAAYFMLRKQERKTDG
jgi:hypothetical protein